MSVRECDYPNCEAKTNGGGGRCTASIETYAGAVLETYERNMSDDSDFYAIVWDAASNSVKTVQYATTRGWTYHNGATVDATPESVAAARDWATDVWESRIVARHAQDAVTPAKGKRVRSLTTRGKNVGVEGDVMWFGRDDYRSDRWVTYYKVGVKVAGEAKLRYMAADRVEVVSAVESLDAADVRQQAWLLAHDRNFRSALESGLSGLTGPVHVMRAEVSA